MGVRTWLGTAHKMRSGEEVVVTGVSMAHNQRVNLELHKTNCRAPNGLYTDEPLFLTTAELDRNSVH